MNYRILSLAALIILASACSTYKTDTKTRFDSVHLSGQKPLVHVGEIHEQADQLTLLGWVEGYVVQPHWFADAPSEQQADIILAEKGAALGADAIIYVSYKTALNASLRKKISARGQAVKLKKENAELARVKNHPPAMADTDAAASADSKPAITQPQAAPEEHGQISKSSQKTLPQTDDSIPDSVEEIIKIRPSSEIKPAEVISLKDQLAAQAAARAKAGRETIVPALLPCEPSINEISERESRLEAINYMIMNADFLLRKSRGLGNREMESAALRLVQLLEQQQAQLKEQLKTHPPCSAR